MSCQHSAAVTGTFTLIVDPPSLSFPALTRSPVCIGGGVFILIHILYAFGRRSEKTCASC